METMPTLPLCSRSTVLRAAPRPGALIRLHLGEDILCSQRRRYINVCRTHTAEHEARRQPLLAHLHRAHAAVDGGGHQRAEQYAGGQPCG